ncbi:MAG: DUF6883 domain-containing protein [Blastocatellia bacterium]
MTGDERNKKQTGSNPPVHLLPNREAAIVEIAKLRDYCLNPESPRGQHNARVFATALELTAENADELRKAILDGIQLYEAASGASDIYGQRYTVDMQLIHQDRKAWVRTGWIVRTEEAFPRLPTCDIVREKSDE